MGPWLRGLWINKEPQACCSMPQACCTLKQAWWSVQQVCSTATDMEISCQWGKAARPEIYQLNPGLTPHSLPPGPTHAPTVAIGLGLWLVAYSL